MPFIARLVVSRVAAHGLQHKSLSGLAVVLSMAAAALALYTADRLLIAAVAERFGPRVGTCVTEVLHGRTAIPNRCPQR